MTKRKRNENKIEAGLKEAVEFAAKANEVQESSYDRAKKRVVAAVAELNAAMASLSTQSARRCSR